MKYGLAHLAQGIGGNLSVFLAFSHSVVYLYQRIPKTGMTDSNSWQQHADSQLWSFYGWWQMSVCLFAFLALMAIWWHIGRKRGDLGQVWLALSVLSWSVSGAIEVYFAHSELSIAKLEGWRSILSLFNSLFILFALPWFRYIPRPINALVKSRYWYYLVGLPFLFSLLPTLSKMVTSNQDRLISELDVYYAVLTLIFLGYVLFWSFAKRRLMMLAYLSILCILVTFAAQLFKLTAYNVNLTLFSAIFKTTLIMLFFALALSWVKELVENVLPASESLFLHLYQERHSGKFTHALRLQGIPGNANTSLKLTPSMYELMLKFAQRRLQGSDWLEIKPKNDPLGNKEYDINDHNQIKRLVEALLDGIFGKGCWTREHHQLPLRETLFEFSLQRSRLVRLRLPAENIKVD